MVEAELPGVKKEDIDLNLNDDSRLFISVNREENVGEKDNANTYIHKERRYDSVQRSLYLAKAKPDGVSAKLENGLLKITRLEKSSRIIHAELNSNDVLWKTSKISFCLFKHRG